MELPGKDIYGVGLHSQVKKIQQDFRLFVTRAKGGLSIKNLKEIFKQYDYNGNGKLELDEFEKCLAAFGVFLKQYEYKLIFNYYDQDKSGNLDFNEFLDGIKQPLNQRRLAMVTKVFNSLDRDNSGQISIEDLSNRVNFDNHQDVLKNKTTNEFKMTEFVGQFEGKSKDGKITLEEFVDYYQDFGMGVPNDDYFIQILEEKWMLTENDEQMIAVQESQQCVESLRQKLIQLSAGNKDDIIIGKIYEQYDNNKDGYIGLDDFQVMLKKLQITVNPKYLSKSYSSIDKNCSGFIEFQEFYDFMVHGL